MKWARGKRRASCRATYREPAEHTRLPNSAQGWQEPASGARKLVLNVPQKLSPALVEWGNFHAALASKVPQISGFRSYPPLLQRAHVLSEILLSERLGMPHPQTAPSSG